VKLQELIQTIQQEKNSIKPSQRRYPVRFLLLSSYKDLKTILHSIHVEVVFLTDLEIFRKNPDAWLFISDVLNLIKMLDSKKDFVVLSLSEFVRFLSEDEFFSLMNSLMEIENEQSNSKRRIYIPLVGITNRFLAKFWQKYHRKNEIEAFWQVQESEEKHHIYFINIFEDIKIENYYTIPNSKNFLEIWKANLSVPSKIVCTSKTLNSFMDKVLNDDIFNVFKIQNPKDYLKYLLGLEVGFDYKQKEKAFWYRLIEEISQKKILNYFELVQDLMNIKKIGPTNVLSLWFKSEDFLRWLIKNYVLIKSQFENTYIRKVINSLESLEKEEIIYKYYILIFEEKKINKNHLEERKITLKNLKEEIDLEKYLRNIEGFLEKKSKTLLPEKFKVYLTGITSYEKKWIIEHFEKIDNLKEIYPELEDYLSEINYPHLSKDQEWVIEYFKEYRISRLKDKPTERLLKILDEKNQDEESFYRCYSSFKNVYDYLDDQRKKVCVDALSLEFLPFIVGLLEKKGFKVKFQIATSNLTKKQQKSNNFYKISQLNDFIRERMNQNQLLNLIQEIEIIKNIIEHIVDYNEKEWMIFSEHGFTSFANSSLQAGKISSLVLSEKNRKYSELEKSPKESFSYEKLNHLKTDCTIRPEEGLIPIIYVQQTKEENYFLRIVAPEISVRNPILIVEIQPEPKIQMVAEYNKKNLSIFYNKEKGYYQVDLSNFKPGSYEILFILGKQEIKKTITLKGGIKERDLL